MNGSHRNGEHLNGYKSEHKPKKGSYQYDSLLIELPITTQILITGFVRIIGSNSLYLDCSSNIEKLRMSRMLTPSVYSYRSSFSIRGW